MRGIAKYARGLFNFFYPDCCFGCGRALQEHEERICLYCLAKLPATNFHLIKENPAEKMFYGRVPIDFASSFLFFSKEGIVRNIMHGIKYQGQKVLAFYMGSLYGKALLLGDIHVGYDAIVPVPLHPGKERRRGYNQSEWIARGISQSLRIPVAKDWLKRDKFSDTQTRKSRFERWKNVETIFSIPDVDIIKNKKIIIVDDVLTTGSTLEACVEKLKTAGAGKIGILTLAFADN